MISVLTSAVYSSSPESVLGWSAYLCVPPTLQTHFNIHNKSLLTIELLPFPWLHKDLSLIWIPNPSLLANVLKNIGVQEYVFKKEEEVLGKDVTMLRANKYCGEGCAFHSQIKQQNIL